MIGKSLLIGFSQVSQHKQLIDYFLSGVKLSDSIMAQISDKLTEGFIPTPVSWDHGVLDSTRKTFSEKLMLALITGIATSAIGNYGVAMGFSPKKRYSC
ncbi:DUF3231 family protein [Virgibacillus byunsanensis]|uniref:DUF3231 family protein n=1 Tax=Virgibacillus byunsanensis TaxID=570945 RepID=A0ABW3LMU2_9BACI